MSVAWGPRSSPKLGSFHSDQKETRGSFVFARRGVNVPEYRRPAARTNWP